MTVVMNIISNHIILHIVCVCVCVLQIQREILININVQLMVSGFFQCLKSMILNVLSLGRPSDRRYTNRSRKEVNIMYDLADFTLYILILVILWYSLQLFVIHRKLEPES